MTYLMCHHQTKASFVQKRLFLTKGSAKDVFDLLAAISLAKLIAIDADVNLWKIRYR